VVENREEEEKEKVGVGEWAGMGVRVGVSVGRARRAAAGEGEGWRRRRRWRVCRARREEERAAAMGSNREFEIGFAVAGSPAGGEVRGRIERPAALEQQETCDEFFSVFFFWSRFDRFGTALLPRF
jgi:hypothetical protein